MTATAPNATQHPYQHQKHQHTRQDPFYWLNQRDNPEVKAYLEEENNYFYQQTQQQQALREELFSEMKARMIEEDQSVPYIWQGYWYGSRMVKGGDYPVYWRKADAVDAQEEIMLDVNVMAQGHAYYQLTGLTLSDDNRYLAFAVDTQSRRLYRLYVKDLQTGQLTDLGIDHAATDLAWAANNETLFWVHQDPKTLRSGQVWCCNRLRPDQKQLVYEEPDDTFDLSVYRSKSKKYITISIESTLTSEYRLADAADPFHFWIFQPRMRGLEYDIAHYQDSFYILTNADGATNFKLMRCAEGQTAKAHWQEVIPHRADVLLEGMDIFVSGLVLSERSQGLEVIRIVPHQGSAFVLPFNSDTYTAYTTTNVDFNSPWLRYAYQSLCTPPSVYEYHMQTGETRLLKQQALADPDFSPNLYEEKRLWVKVRDGVQVPVSVVYHRNVTFSPQTPVLLYGYGAYGLSMECHFSSVRLSLLNRGFVFAIAHIRGGEEMGRHWYEQGKLKHKWNTFCDFIDVAQFFVDQGWTSPEHLYAEGGSAGGLLMGTVINERPDLFKGVIAQVPFVDVVTTMLDEDIPLTTSEYDEWGNPNEKSDYDYMLSYSPYDQVKAQPYPALLVTTGWHDSQVQYWEPAKWVAKLRLLKTDTNPLYLVTEFDTGHGGKSGRFEALREFALEYAFLLNLEHQG